MMFPCRVTVLAGTLGAQLFTVVLYFSLLRERLDTEARAEPQQAKNGLNVMPVTKKFLFSIMECAELLCNVTIEASRKKPVPERTISHCSFAPDHGQQSKQGTFVNRFNRLCS